MVNIVLGKKFAASPSQEEILALLTAGQPVDIKQANKSVTEIIAHVKDLLTLKKFTEDLTQISARQADLFKEQEQAGKDLAGVKAEVVEAKKELAGVMSEVGKAQEGLKTQAAKIDQANQDLAALEMVKKSLAKEIEDKRNQKALFDQSLKAEYDRLRQEMLARLKTEEVEASVNLKARLAEIAAAEDRLAQVKKAMSDLAKGLAG